MKARIGESLFGLLKRKSDQLDKVSFTSIGFETIKQTIYDNPIRIGINRGAIVNEIATASDGTVTDLRPVIFIPELGDVPAGDIASRVLNDVVVEVVYASPIHYVTLKIGVVLTR